MKGVKDSEEVKMWRMEVKELSSRIRTIERKIRKWEEKQYPIRRWRK